jgi:hypothetical protein
MPPNEAAQAAQHHGSTNSLVFRLDLVLFASVIDQRLGNRDRHQCGRGVTQPHTKKGNRKHDAKYDMVLSFT